MERKPFNWPELFYGNWEIFKEAAKNPDTKIVYDIDGVLANSAEIVLRRFSKKYNIPVKPIEIDSWDFLTKVLKNNGFPDDVVKHAEDDWFKAEVLETAQRYLYARPLVQLTTRYYGPEKNFILTSRNPQFKNSTVGWFMREFPEINTENILIRANGGRDLEDSSKFKVDSLKYLGISAPWVIFIDDSVDFARAVSGANLPNCLIINAPQGKIMPDFADKNSKLFFVKRYPEEIQAMSPLLHAFNRVIGF